MIKTQPSDSPAHIRESYAELQNYLAQFRALLIKQQVPITNQNLLGRG